MSDSYSGVKSGKLKLKGEKSKKSKKKSKKRERDEHDQHKQRKKLKYQEQDDIRKHGGWWCTKEFKHVSGPIAIQIKGCFLKAVDDGTFTLGAPHDDGDGPDPEEVLLAVKVTDTKIALKSGFEKYLRVDNKDYVVRGTADAVGPMEQWEPIFQDGKLALLGANSKFLSLNGEDETIVCEKSKAGDDEMIKIRSNAEREEDKKAYVPDEEQGNVGQIELNYVKKFQKFQDHKIKLNSSDRRELMKAKTEGDMHELMLDRRAKMKADRYCK